MKPVPISRNTPSTPCTSRCHAVQTGSSSGWKLSDMRAKLPALLGKKFARPGRPVSLYIDVGMAPLLGYGGRCTAGIGNKLQRLGGGKGGVRKAGKGPRAG